MSRTAALLTVVLVLSSCGQAEERQAEDRQPATGTSPSPSAVDGCPERFPARTGDEPWVPSPPTTETPGRLVPDADPVEALVCRYSGVVDAAPAALEGQVQLEGGLDRIRTDLLVPSQVEGAEPACTMASGRQVPHLVRLRYADGDLWLSTVQERDRCPATGNGAFVSPAFLGDVLAQAYDSATWPAQAPEPCATPSPGRAGQEQTLVPPGWTSLVLCREPDGPRGVEPDRAAQAASLLGQLRASPATDVCEGTITSARLLLFTYDEGPPVAVMWTRGCEPSLGNGSLSAALTPAQTELLGVLLG